MKPVLRQNWLLSDINSLTVSIICMQWQPISYMRVTWHLKSNHSNNKLKKKTMATISSFYKCLQPHNLGWLVLSEGGQSFFVHLYHHMWRQAITYHMVCLHTHIHTHTNMGCLDLNALQHLEYASSTLDKDIFFISHETVNHDCMQVIIILIFSRTVIFKEWRCNLCPINMDLWESYFQKNTAKACLHTLLCAWQTVEFFFPTTKVFLPQPTLMRCHGMARIIS